MLEDRDTSFVASGQKDHAIKCTSVRSILWLIKSHTIYGSSIPVEAVLYYFTTIVRCDHMDSLLASLLVDCYSGHDLPNSEGEEYSESGRWTHQIRDLLQLSFLLTVSEIFSIQRLDLLTKNFRGNSAFKFFQALMTGPARHSQLFSGFLLHL